MFLLKATSDFDKGFKEIQREFEASVKKVEYIKNNVGSIFIKYVQKELEGCVVTGNLMSNFGVGTQGIHIKTPTYTIVGTKVPYAAAVDIGVNHVWEIKAKNFPYMTFYDKRTQKWTKRKKVIHPAMTGKFYTLFAVNNTFDEIERIFISKDGGVVTV